MNDNKVKNLLLKTKDFNKTNIIKIEELNGDASGRNYHRIHIDHPDFKTLILMELADDKAPPVSGDSSMHPNDSFIEMAYLLADHGVPVPRIILDQRKENLILIEDVGNFALSDIFRENKSQELKEFIDQNNLNLIDSFKKSIDIIASLQKIKEEKNIAFKRSIKFEQYKNDANSLITNYLESKNTSASHIKRIDSLLDNLCESISSHPVKLCHRDFMPWNLQIDYKSKIRLIDFQDSCLGSQELDIISLIHDRDCDFMIGDKVCKELIEYYKETLSRDSSFKERYLEILLHRNLRLAGHFNYLTKITGKEIYKSWVPGCLKRSGRIIALLPHYSDIIDIISDSSKEIISGVDKPLDIFPNE